MKSLFAVVFVLVVSAPASAQVLEVVEPSPPPPTPAPSEETEEDVRVYTALGMWGEAIDLSGRELAFGDPEIQAVRGLRLGGDWAGNAALREQPLMGGSLTVGLRVLEFIRGPEVRLMLGEGSRDSYFYAPTSVPGIDVKVQSALLFRGELAVGLQLPIDFFVPWVLARASLSAAWIDVGVQHSELGYLGSERVEISAAELGFEAGAGFRINRHLELSIALRRSFLGAEAWGVSVSIGAEH